jgi:hypothetical protein
LETQIHTQAALVFDEQFANDCDFGWGFGCVDR